MTKYIKEKHALQRSNVSITNECNFFYFVVQSYTIYQPIFAGAPMLKFCSSSDIATDVCLATSIACKKSQNACDTVLLISYRELRIYPSKMSQKKAGGVDDGA